MKNMNIFCTGNDELAFVFEVRKHLLSILPSTLCENSGSPCIHQHYARVSQMDVWFMKTIYLLKFSYSGEGTVYVWRQHFLQCILTQSCHTTT